MKSNQLYFENINIARGMAILLVVIGHALTDSFQTDGIWHTQIPAYFFMLIYSFHMPLFFFLSGFCNHKIINLDDRKKKKMFLWRRFRRLMIPYFVWGILYVFLDIIGGNYTLSEFRPFTYLLELLQGDNANWQLWTLYVLFICGLLSMVLLSNRRQLLEPVMIASGILFVCYLFLNMWDVLPYIIYTTIIFSTILYFFFFVLGIWVWEKGWIQDGIFKKKGILIISMFILLFQPMVRIVLDRMQPPILQGQTEILKLLGAPAGIYVLLYVSIVVCDGKAIKKICNLLGDNCMNIYIFANILQVVIRRVSIRLGFQGFISFILSVCLGIMIPIFIHRVILSRFKVIDGVFLGNV